MQRDNQNNQKLYDAGWYVMRFWEHQIKKDFEEIINRIISYLQDNN